MHSFSLIRHKPIFVYCPPESIAQLVYVIELVIPQSVFSKVNPF